MTKEEIIATIRNEIERLKGQLIRGACAAQISFETSCKDEAYNEILSFLDTLESEKPIEGLEEEINRYLEPIHTADIQFEPFTQMTKCARHFAEWGYLRAAEKYNEIEYNRQRAEESGSSEIPNDLEEAARHSEILTYPMPEDGDMEKVFKVQEARVFHEIGFIAGAEWAMNRFEPATFGNTLGDTELFKKK